MSRKKYYLPSEDGKLATWFQNLSSKIGGYASKYGLSAAEVTFIQEAAAFFIFWYTALSQLKAAVQKVTAYKKEILHGVKAGGSPSVVPNDIVYGTPPTAVSPGILVIVRSIAARIKKHQGYTIADGEDLRIEGDENSEDLNSLTPVFKIEMKSGHPDLIWKKGLSEGVKIKKGILSKGETPPTDGGNVAFSLLAIDTQPNYLDTSALPPFGQSVVWVYTMIYILGDEEIGNWSPVQFVTVSGTP